nr:glutamic acid-rich protein-like [Ipomoea batatas]
MLNNEDILRRELKRMYAWQKWRMSTLKVIGRTCSMMGEEKEWAMNWMGTRSIFDATRLDEIDRVFVEKLEGQLIKNGKGRELDTAFLNPREQEIEELIAVGKICNISRVQSSIRDTRLGVGTSRRTNESSSSARGENMKASCGANHDDLTLKTDDNADILANDLVDVDLKMSSSLARDETKEASRSASHEDSYPRNDPSDTHLVDVDIQVDSKLARDENLEALRGDSNNDKALDSQSTEVLSGSIPAFSSILSAIQDLEMTQSTQFKSLNESIAKFKKDPKKQKKRSSKSPMLAQTAKLEEKLERLNLRNRNLLQP